MQAVSQFILEILLFLYQFTDNLGLAIILFTVLVRTVLLPLTISSLKANNNLRKLQPEIAKLKKKHGKDKKKLQAAQVELYQKYNVNPLAGCIPQLVQLALIIVLYRVLFDFIGQSEINGEPIHAQFLWLDLTQRDPLYLAAIITTISQFVLSFMIAPVTEVEDKVPNKSKNKKIKKANEKEEDFAEMAASMQQQMIYVLPVMSGIIALQFPSGVALYWIVTNIYSIVQQYYISGWGGLKTYSQRTITFIRSKIV